MTSFVLVINSGSSSMKYQLVDPAAGTAAATGLIERIGGEGVATHKAGGETADLRRADPRPRRGADDHAAAVRRRRAAAVGGRAGGGRAPGGARRCRCSATRSSSMTMCCNRSGTCRCWRRCTIRPMPPASSRPWRPSRGSRRSRSSTPRSSGICRRPRPPTRSTETVAAEQQIRRYGFHGTSHQYVSHLLPAVLGRDVAELKTIVLHLGNGASASAVAVGAAVETSMGLTPLEGLVMGTRSGDIDPGVVFHLLRNAGMDADQIDNLLNRRSGVLGLSGVSDFRDLHKLIAVRRRGRGGGAGRLLPPGPQVRRRLSRRAGRRGRHRVHRRGRRERRRGPGQDPGRSGAAGYLGRSGAQRGAIRPMPG